MLILDESEMDIITLKELKQFENDLFEDINELVKTWCTKKYYPALKEENMPV